MQGGLHGGEEDLLGDLCGGCKADRDGRAASTDQRGAGWLDSQPGAKSVGPERQGAGGLQGGHPRERVEAMGRLEVFFGELS